MDDDLVLRELWDPATGGIYHMCFGRHDVTPYMRLDVVRSIVRNSKRGGKPMTIHSFDSVEDMFAAMEKAQVLADSNVQGWQKTLDPGSYFIREAQGFQIFCEVLPWPDEEEGEQGNYRFCKCYSTSCPDGELGDVHISTAGRRITGEEFNAAKLAGWQ